MLRQKMNRKYLKLFKSIEPQQEKTNNVVVCPVQTQISLGIRPVWSEPSLSVWS